MQKVIAIVAIFGFVLTPITVQSSGSAFLMPDPGMLPGSPWYVFKRMSERIGTMFAFGDVVKTERYLMLSERRLAEAERLFANEEQERAEQAIERYQSKIERAIARAKSANERGTDTGGALEVVSEATLRHQDVLASVYDKVPDQAKPAIQRAMDAGKRGNEEAINAIGGERGQLLRQLSEEKLQEAQRGSDEAREGSRPSQDIPPMPEGVPTLPVDLQERSGQMREGDQPTQDIPDAPTGYATPPVALPR